jgi:hypothetical protein
VSAYRNSAYRFKPQALNHHRKNAPWMTHMVGSMFSTTGSSRAETDSEAARARAA